MTSGDPWCELTPGALGRLALNADPTRCANDLRRWVGPFLETRSELAVWFRAVADELAGVAR